MYNVVCVEGGPEKSSKNNPDEGMNNTIMVMKERMKIREHNKPEIFELVRWRHSFTYLFTVMF